LARTVTGDEVEDLTAAGAVGHTGIVQVIQERHGRRGNTRGVEAPEDGAGQWGGQWQRPASGEANHRREGKHVGGDDIEDAGRRSVQRLE
jgi:hypothetical protein